MSNKLSYNICGKTRLPLQVVGSSIMNSNVQKQLNFKGFLIFLATSEVVLAKPFLTTRLFLFEFSKEIDIQPKIDYLD